MKGMAILEAHFPNMKLTKDRLYIWRSMTHDLIAEEFIRGIRTFCLAHKEIFPNTNIIAYIREYACRDQTQKNAAEAWAEVLMSVRQHGYSGKPKFSSPWIEKAVDCIGWRDICMSEKIGVERAHFSRAYESIIERERFDKIAGSVMGDNYAENGKR